MRNIIREPGHRLPKPDRDREEFGLGKKGLETCTVCGSYYYKKSWHHPSDLKLDIKNLKLKKVLCPADQMIRNKQYEGKVIINNIPAKIEVELMNVIKNSGEQGFSMDPMHRVISVKKERNNLIVTTTENELANKIARKIKSVFHKVSTKISFGKEPSDVAVATIDFLFK